MLHTARVAVETDYEYFTKFNDVTAATNYVLVTVVQPTALQAVRVTCLVPSEEKVTVGFCCVEVPWPWARPARSARPRHEQRIAWETERPEGDGERKHNQVIESPAPALDRTEAGGGRQPDPPP